MYVHMKNQVISSIIIALLLSTTLGLMTMNHMDQDHDICPFEVPGVASCVQVYGAYGFIASHLNAFSRYVSAIPVNSFGGIFLLFLSMIFLTSTLLSENTKSFKFRSILISNRLREILIIPKRTTIIDWLAIHENSPAILARR